MIKDICVYATPEVLNHKARDGDVYWKINKLPTNWSDLWQDGRIYFAVGGFIVGYFVIDDINDITNQIEWNSDTWTFIKPIPQRPFQGFKYIDRGVA